MTTKTNGKASAKAGNGKADGEFTIAALAKELKLDPRKARVRLRASDLKHEPGGSWTFPKADREKIVAIIYGHTRPLT